MPAGAWNRVQELFLDAVDLPSGERDRFLDEACRGDAELRRDVDSLLAADSESGERIIEAIERTAQSVLGAETVVGSRIGSYRVIRELGRGGMGSVYLAVRDDDQYEKQVAIKLIRRGMDTDDVLDRFRHERQILANLEHPYIARLLDGGTSPDGRPFFVMEYVQGRPLDQYCRERELSVRERCRLFLKVCEAVSFAHRSLVVHRDLKPGNILVTPDGSPKLLDFGVAKLLDPSAASGRTMTVLAMRPLTPEYASPEQVRSGQISTATDVYTLGAILYELLSGKRPHEFSSYSPIELERVICDVDPPPPSETNAALRKQLAGDLDAIVAKAMRKEPELRYASVEQMAEDLNRYLNGWAVEARQGSFTYRAAKFLRRNRTAIAVGVLFAAALIGGAAVATIQAIRASREQARAEHQRELALQSEARAEASRREAEREAAEAQTQRSYADSQRHEAELQSLAAETQRRLAERRFEQVRQLARKFLLDFHDAIAKLPGSTPARKMVVETGLQYYDGLVREAHGNPELLKEIARGYDRLGDVQGNPYYANLGDLNGALASYRKALGIRERISDHSPVFVSERIRGNSKIGQILTVQGDLKTASSTLESNIAMGEADPTAHSYEVRDALANAYSSYGDLKMRMASFGEAIAPFTKLLAVSEDLAREGRDPAGEQRGISLAHTKLGDALNRLDRQGDALDQLRLALEIDQRQVAADPNNVPQMRKLFITYIMMGRALRTRSGARLGQPGEARTVLEAAANLADKMAAADPNNNQTLADVMNARSSLGDYLRQQNEIDAAVASYRIAVEVTERMRASGPLALLNLDPFVQARHRLGIGLIAAGKPEEALASFRSAAEALAVAEKQNPGMIRIVTRRAEILEGEGQAYALEKRWQDAIEAMSVTVVLFEDLRKRDPQNDQFLNEQPEKYAMLADYYAGAGQLDAASRALHTSLDRMREIEAKRALIKEEQDDRATRMAKLAEWERK